MRRSHSMIACIGPVLRFSLSETCLGNQKLFTGTRDCWRMLCRLPAHTVGAGCGSIP